MAQFPPIAFTKMHGCANDYLFLDAIATPNLTHVDARTVQAMCDRRTGIGADGVIVLSRTGEQWEARVINADGSAGGMCGNGLRCAARLFHERHCAPEHLTIHMGGRAIAARVEGDRVSLDMGQVHMELAPMGIDLPSLGASGAGPIYALHGMRVGFADIGNPHMALVVDAPPTEAQLAEFGPRFERHPAFSHGMNVHLVCIENSRSIIMRTHERGVGPTQACGSGACAVVALLAHAGLVSDEADVTVPGGVLQVNAPIGASVTLTGPTAYVCDGTFLV